MAGAKYRVLVGLSYPPDRRAEYGDIVDDIPSRSLKWLVDQGAVEMVTKSGESAPVTDRDQVLTDDIALADPQES
jgi:hypothetical protein